MTTFQIQCRVAMYSNETLREIVASKDIRWAWFKFHARAELARRDLETGLWEVE